MPVSTPKEFSLAGERNASIRNSSETVIEQNIRHLTYKIKAVNAVVFHSKRRVLMLGALNLCKGLTEKMDSFRSHEL